MSTNSELLRTPRKLLTTLEQQAVFLLHMALEKHPCPVCGKKQDQLEAAGITLDEYSVEEPSPPFACVECHTPIVIVVPMISTERWFWVTKDAAERKD